MDLAPPPFRPRTMSRGNSHASQGRDTVSSTYSQEFENSFGKLTSLSSSRSWFVNVMFVSGTLLSLACKIWSLIVYFSRMRVQVMLLGPNLHPDHDDKSPPAIPDLELINTFLIDFSFPEMVRDFWHARAYFVSIVIVIGSAIVPLSRHAFFLWAWFMPTHPRGTLSTIRTRGLLFFDHVGRTSLVDLFLMGYVACIFYTQVNQFIITDKVGIRIQLNGEPVRGLFLGISTTIAGAFLNHYMILVDEERLMGRAERRVTVGAGPPVASLWQRLWASPETGCFKLIATITLAGLVISCTTLMFILFFGNPLVAFHMEGLAGVVADEDWRDFYLLTAPLDMPSRTTNTSGGHVLSILYIAVVVIVPMALLLATTVLWLVPLDLRQQRTALSLYPFWFSWCAVDVLFITTLASFLEMHLIAEFTFDNKFKVLCSEVKSILDMPCSSLGRKLESGLPVLGVVSILFAMLHFVFAKIAARLLESEPAASTIWPIDSPFAEHFMSSATTSPRLALESPIVIGRGQSTLTALSSNNNQPLLTHYKDSTSSAAASSSMLLNENVHARRVVG